MLRVVCCVFCHDFALKKKSNVVVPTRLQLLLGDGFSMWIYHGITQQPAFFIHFKTRSIIAVANHFAHRQLYYATIQTLLAG